MLEFNEIKNKDKAIMIRAKLNEMLKSIIDGTEGLRSLWKELKATNLVLKNLSKSTDEKYSDLKQGLFQSNNYTDKKTSEVYNKLTKEIAELKSATLRNKGYFESSLELKLAWPSAEIGCIAYVGLAHPYSIWKWTTDGWVDTKQKGGQEVIPLNNYVTYDSLGDINGGFTVQLKNSLGKNLYPTTESSLVKMTNYFTPDWPYDKEPITRQDSVAAAITKLETASVADGIALNDQWGTMPFGGFLETASVEETSIDSVPPSSIFFVNDRHGFVFMQNGKYYNNTAENGPSYNTDGFIAKQKTYFMLGNVQYYFNGTTLIGIVTKISEGFSEVNEYNISAITGTTYADLQGAINALNTYLKDGKSVGLKCTFVNTDSKKPETWIYQGGSFVATNSWSCTNTPEVLTKKVEYLESAVQELVTAKISGEGDQILDITQQKYL